MSAGTLKLGLVGPLLPPAGGMAVQVEVGRQDVAQYSWSRVKPKWLALYGRCVVAG